MAQPVGFFTDATLCIGCKACEVACKEWNQLPNNPLEFRDSYDNTGQLDHANWRHVRFVEQPTKTPDKPIAWSMMSDVCKHCANASCLEVCPTNAIVFGDMHDKASEVAKTKKDIRGYNLLNELNNNTGAVTRVAYRPSTYFYLADERNPQTRWRTPLPFPVQVVARVSVAAA